MSMTDRYERFTLNYNLEIIVSGIFIHMIFYCEGGFACQIKNTVKLTFIAILGWCLLECGLLDCW